MIPRSDHAAACREDNARLDLLEAIAGQVGALRHPTTGTIRDVRYDPEPEIFANSCHELAPHCDEAYLHMPPSITCFRFVKAAAEGGETTLTDAFRIGAELKARHPEAFALFCRGPVFSLDDEGDIAGFRMLDHAIGPLDAAEEDIEPFHETSRLLLGMLHDRKKRILLPMASGEVLFFNNHRVIRTKLC